MTQKNSLFFWLDKVESLSQKIFQTVNSGNLPDKNDLDNRQRLIKIVRQEHASSLTLEQINRINAILEQDTEIIRQLELLSVKIKAEIGKAYLNRNAISKFNLSEL